MKKIITITVEKTSTGFSGYANEVPGIYSVGENFEELKTNINEVLNEQIAYLKEMGDNETANSLAAATLEYKIDLEQFFEHYSMINKSEFAKYINLNPSLLRQYAKGLVPVSDQRLLEIESGIHKLAKDLSQVSFA